MSYAVTERDFELSELKILLDCVQVSKFISENRTEKLTKKLCSLCSRYEATQLRGQVHRNHVKAEITRFIIILIRYIRQSRINCFYLFNISSIYLQKKRRARHDGKNYVVFSLRVDLRGRKNYYLLAAEADEVHSQDYKVKHFRVDRMKS